MEEMTPAERIRAQTKEATRTAFLQAGLDETIEANGTFPTLEAVCSRAGYTRGAFYGYFEDREQFIAEMLEWVLNDIIQSLFDTTTEGDADIFEIVARFNETALSGEWPDIQRNVRIGYLAVLRELRPGSPVRHQHADLMTGIIDRLEQRIREGQGEGTVRKGVKPRDLATLLLLVAIGSITWNGLGILGTGEGEAAALVRLLAPQ